MHLELINAVKRFECVGDSFELLVPSVKIKRGLTYVVVGKSGCGKTTFLDALGCISKFDYAEKFILYSSSEGAITLHNASSRCLARVRRLNLGYVLQQGGLLPFLTVKQNILLPLRLSQRNKAYGDDALELAAHLGMSNYFNYYPSELSIGQRQRISIVRALIHRPQLVLADEPTGALDPASAISVREILKKCAQFYGATMIIVTHDADLFKPIANGLLEFDIVRHHHCTYSTVKMIEGMCE